MDYFLWILSDCGAGPGGLWCALGKSTVLTSLFVVLAGGVMGTLVWWLGRTKLGKEVLAEREAESFPRSPLDLCRWENPRRRRPR